ncbi:MAG TPA: substrate-binding domain-containing protein [Acidimicrobiales bacterium]|nr:substrate-binding domain-containing protein [Acidimicrobiales bacterium]
MHHRARKAGLAAVASALLFTAACGNDNSGEESGTDATVPEGIEGSVSISGSSTVEPISAAVREAFVAQNDAVDITVEGPGTGDGFEKFCGGETDISDASRPIDEEEVAACEAEGVEFVELEIGLDGIAVIAAEDNPVECLTFADLYALAGPEAEGVDTWAGAQEVATALGSETELPEESLTITAPGEESGTYDSFIEIALAGPAEARVTSGDITEDQAEATRADYSANANDNAIVEGVAAEPGGLGWVGFAFADRAEGVRLMPIAAEPGQECVEPSLETIQDGSYPLSRSLYIYVNKARAEEDEAVAAFVDFYLDGLAGFVEGADYVALDDQAPTDAAWEDRTAGTRVEAG